MMQKSTWLMFVSILGMLQANAQSVDSTFHNLVCQQCKSWCSADQRVQIEARTGKAGPRGPPGRAGPVGPAGRQGVAGPVGQKGDPGVVNMTLIEELITNKIDEALSARQAPPITSPIAIPTGTIKTYSSCRGVNLASAKSRNETGGVFDIAIPGVGTKEVYCNTEIDGGGWIVMQRRMDGSVDFYRTWNEYVAGFGQASGEYWLGLEALYQLTKNGNVELRIDMITHGGTFYYAKYSNFQIGPSSDNYRLRVSGYSGNATDSLARHNNDPFSTKDNDNDRISGRNCAADYSGASWFDYCHSSHLNGDYKRRDGRFGVAWHHSSTIVHLKFTEMKIRQKN